MSFNTHSRYNNWCDYPTWLAAQFMLEQDRLDRRWEKEADSALRQAGGNKGKATEILGWSMESVLIYSGGDTEWDKFAMDAMHNAIDIEEIASVLIEERLEAALERKFAKEPHE